MKLVKTFACLLAMLIMAAPVMAASNNVTIASKAEVEVQETTPQGEKVWVRKPPALVVPGTVVIYTNTFTNNGKEPATDLVVTNPIPASMVYVAASAHGENAETTLSADGAKSFAAEGQLQVIEADGNRRPAAPQDITHVRWQILKPLPPSDSGQVEFRARVK